MCPGMRVDAPNRDALCSTVTRQHPAQDSSRVGRRTDGHVLRHVFWRCFYQGFCGSTGDTGDCDYCCSSRVSVADTAAVGQLICAGMPRAYVDIENSGIPYDPESGSYMSDFVCLEDAFAENDVFCELVTDAGSSERLFRDLMSDSAPNAPGGCLDELENGLAHLVEIDAWFDPGTG